MKILFLGQLGIPTTFGASGMAENRALRLGSLLSEAGHEVLVTATSPYFPAHIQRSGKMRIIHWPSFNPQNAGGWLYELLTQFSVWKLQPQVVHIQSWRGALLARLGVLLSPHSTFVWTINSLPASSPRMISLLLRFTKGAFDAIVCPTRTLQYQLLMSFGLRTTYVPDGYMQPTLPAIAASTWGLRKEQYAITEVTNASSVSHILTAYKATRSQKKLVVLVPEKNSALTRLEKKYSFLQLVISPTPRVKTSLISQAAVVIVAEQQSQEFALQAMEAGRAIVALNHSLNQELLGTTAQFVEASDEAGLTDILTDLLFYPMKRAAWGKKASHRARAHFLWQRIVEEYVTAYHYPAVKLVPVDSIQRVLVRQSLA